MKKVLIVDNDLDFLETRVGYLRREGYTVVEASTIEQAEQVLGESWIHVAIIDLRMREDADDKDTSGLALAQDAQYRHIPKIILTRYPSFKDVRTALGPAVEGLPAAVDFIAKQEGLSTMLRSVEQVFANYVRINWDLSIIWQDLRSFHHLVAALDPQIADTRLAESAHELEDLFRKLFYDHTQISIGKRLKEDDGHVLLKVFAYRDSGVAAQYVVSCGRKATIIDESTRYDRFVPEQAGRSTTNKVKTIETSCFAATVYSLLGGDLEEIRTLREFYQTQTPEEIGAAVNHLFTATLAAWHTHGRFYEKDQPLHQLLFSSLSTNGLTPFPERLKDRVEAICHAIVGTGLGEIEYTAHTLTLHLPDGSRVAYPHPAVPLEDGFSTEGNSVLCGVIHGHVDPDTVLVNTKAHTWLIDFTQTETGPLLRDFVSLEMAIKLELLDTSSLALRYELEKHLLDVSNLADSSVASGVAPEIQRALWAVEDIRQLAARIPGENLVAYFTGLFYAALNQIAAFDVTLHNYRRREVAPYAHALVLAAMLAEKLAGSTRRSMSVPEQARTHLWIDDGNKEVWVEGRPIQLTPQDFKVLAFLYQHANQLCSRQTLVEEALDDEYAGPDTEESRINSALSRLRQKIEPNPKQPKYLKTVRGHGYKLVL